MAVAEAEEQQKSEREQTREQRKSTRKITADAAAEEIKQLRGQLAVLQQAASATAAAAIGEEERTAAAAHRAQANAEREAIAASAFEQKIKDTIKATQEHNTSSAIPAPLVAAAVRQTMIHAQCEAKDAAAAAAAQAGVGAAKKLQSSRTMYSFDAPLIYESGAEMPVLDDYMNMGAGLMIFDPRKRGHTRFRCSCCGSESMEVPLHFADVRGGLR